MLAPLCLLAALASVAAQVCQDISQGTSVAKGVSDQPLTIAASFGMYGECHKECPKDLLLCSRDMLPEKILVTVMDDLKYPEVSIAEGLDLVSVSRRVDEHGNCPGTGDVTVYTACPA